jgi:hypothetical protein
MRTDADSNTKDLQPFFQMQMQMQISSVAVRAESKLAELDFAFAPPAAWELMLAEIADQRPAAMSARRGRR